MCRTQHLLRQIDVSRPRSFIGVFDHYQLDQVTQSFWNMIRNWLQVIQYNYHHITKCVYLKTSTVTRSQGPHCSAV